MPVWKSRSDVRDCRVIDRLGDFELLKRLGAGAQAEVYLAATADGQLLALKVMLEHLTVKDESRAAFLREGRTASLLKHPNLVEVYDAGENDGRPWISMELVRGHSLSALLKKLRAEKARLDQDEAAELIRQAALGLHFAHEVKGNEGEPLGLVHRDVSPQNIMVSETGFTKVVDFGLAKATAQSDTVTTTIKGKLRYMPPEQLKSQKLDRRCDVFALGAVLWELACGSQLYPGASEAEVVQQALYNAQPHPDEVAKGLSRGMVQVLLATTQRDVERRMASAKELAEALAPLSSPHARDKLGERIAKYFERLPKTLDEARGTESSGPTQALTMPAAPLVPPPGKGKRVGVLAPPAAKPKYVTDGPVPAKADSRERRTDQVEAPYSKARATKVDRTAPPVPDDPTGPNPKPALVEGDTALSLPAQLESDGARGSGTTLPPLMDADTGLVTAPGMQTAVTALDPETGRELLPPSRRMVIVAVCASIGIIGLGGLVGTLLRSTDEPDPATTGQRGAEPAVVPEDTIEVPMFDGGPTAAHVAVGKKPGRMGRVEIDANVPAVVRERNADLGVTPFSRAFSPGRHKLQIATPDGQASIDMDLVVRPGETVRRSVKLGGR